MGGGGTELPACKTDDTVSRDVDENELSSFNESKPLLDWCCNVPLRPDNTYVTESDRGLKIGLKLSPLPKPGIETTLLDRRGTSGGPPALLLPPLMLIVAAELNDTVSPSPIADGEIVFKLIFEWDKKLVLAEWEVETDERWLSEIRTLANTEKSCADKFEGGECSGSLVGPRGINGNVLGIIEDDEAASPLLLLLILPLLWLLCRLPFWWLGLMPGDFKLRSGQRRGCRKKRGRLMWQVYQRNTYEFLWCLASTWL